MRFFPVSAMTMRMGCAVAVFGFSSVLSHSETSVPLVHLSSATSVAMTPLSGLVFDCGSGISDEIQSALEDYFVSMGVNLDHVSRTVSPGIVSFRLAHDYSDANTLDLIDRLPLNITEEKVVLPIRKGFNRTVLTVSKKEILYALLQSGRATTFSGQNCSLQALQDHVGVRHNIVAWSEVLEWKWPDGGSAKWNPKYWRKGDPIQGHPLHVAVNDAFVNQSLYAIGCYTAAKLVMLQGVLDYYHRIKKDPVALASIEQNLLKENDPLTTVEPGAFWSFEPDNTPEYLSRPGTIMSIHENVAPKNFIPGDWAYFLNTDPVTYQKTGYEGSNAIYQGRGKFDDFYNDNNHSYTYKQKLHEVYQWRNGVFSASRDTAKVKPLTPSHFELLSFSPSNGGLQVDKRLVPRFLNSTPTHPLQPVRLVSNTHTQD